MLRNELKMGLLKNKKTKTYEFLFKIKKNIRKELKQKRFESWERFIKMFNKVKNSKAMKIITKIQQGKKKFFPEINDIDEIVKGIFPFAKEIQEKVRTENVQGDNIIEIYMDELKGAIRASAKELSPGT